MGKPKQWKMPDLNLSPRELGLLLAGKFRGARWVGCHRDADEAWAETGETLIQVWSDPALEGREVRLGKRENTALRIPGPGHRPWYWWHRVAPEPRRLILNDGTTEAIWTRLWAKSLEYDWGGPRGRFALGIPTQHPQGLNFETEGEYLERLNLLLPEEK